VTAADRACGVLVIFAASFVAWACVRGGANPWMGAAVVLAGGAVCAHLWFDWRRARRSARRHLEARPDGTLWLHEAGRDAVPVTLGRGTRLLGPSVFLDLHVAYPASPERVQRWISPFDAPGHVMRQWSVVLPRCGRAACT
jgi:hypothetical protein